ncbi:MAG: prepilin-type N-terminal cleavage/methylation domain-containing protein [Verrucomicrobiota bacterium]
MKYTTFLNQRLKPKRGRDFRRGFSMIELLAVLTIIVTLTTVGVVSTKGFSANGFNGALTSISATIDQARQYAISQNTYVWVAMNEQTINSQNTISIAILASVDGTDSINWSGIPTQDDPNLTLVSKIMTIPALRLSAADPLKTRIPDAPTTSASDLANTITFRVRHPELGGVTNFDQVLQFSPRGEARTAQSLSGYIDFGLEPSDNQNQNAAIIRILGFTGTTKVYRL